MYANVALSRIVLAAFLFSSGCAVSESNTAKRDIRYITNVTILDPLSRSFFQQKTIVISNGRIVSVRDANGESIPGALDARNMIAIPGFVNTHTHLWQHVAKSQSSDAVLQNWIRVVYPFAHYISNEELKRLTYIAARHAQLSGVTTLVDFASVNFRHQSLEATIDALVQADMDGAVVWWHPAVYLLEEQRAAYFNALNERSDRLEIAMGFGPLSFMPISAVYDGVLLGRRSNSLLTEHTMENIGEARDIRAAMRSYVGTHENDLSADDFRAISNIAAVPAPPENDLAFRAKRVLARLNNDDQSVPRLPTSIPVLEQMGALDGFLSIHSVWLNNEDIETLAKHGAAVSHNPESNMYLSSGPAPLVAYEREGVTLTLGTDGAASNDRIDMFTAMRSALNLAKVSNLDTGRSSELDSWDILYAATLGGAESLKAQDRIGSISAGKEADIVLLSLDSLGLAPIDYSRNAASLIVNSASARDVHSVISNGKLLVHNHRLISDSEMSLASELNEIYETVLARRENGWVVDHSYDLADDVMDYFSVRRSDEIRIEIRNSDSVPHSIRIIFAGDVFGGRTRRTLAAEALERFPMSEERSNELFRVYSLEHGESIQVLKNRGDYIMKIVEPSGEVSVYERGPEQVHFSRRVPGDS